MNHFPIAKSGSSQNRNKMAWKPACPASPSSDVIKFYPFLFPFSSFSLFICSPLSSFINPGGGHETAR